MNGMADLLKNLYGDLITEETLEKLRKMRNPNPGPIKTVKVVDAPTFAANVFGGDCFLTNFPAILTTGVRVMQRWGYGHQSWYVIDENNNAYHDSTFFSEKEMKYLVEVIDEGL